MKSSVRFSLAPEGPRSMQPVILVNAISSDDPRDSVACHFTYRMGNKHRFLNCTSVMTSYDVSDPNFVSMLSIENYKPDSDLYMLDGTDIAEGNKEAFFIALRSLCDEYKACIDWAPYGRHLPVDKIQTP